ncbi:aminoglycoside phosphotransferase family protein [Kitasatospora sp. LaBMicrA B282]|uniref:aminoglycoside phosphotransferase family protein n=1 Tax=Kitasatospora sp. LaBMicrA B282 TaxID=3420949 RepID=UPI003D0E9F7F
MDLEERSTVHGDGLVEKAAERLDSADRLAAPQEEECSLVGEFSSRRWWTGPLGDDPVELLQAFLLESLLDDAVGRWQLVSVRSRDRTGAPSVWEVAGPAGHRWFAKRHWHTGRYRRETRAYDEFVPLLGAGRASRITRRVPEARLIVTRGLGGHPLREAQLTDQQVPEVYRQAGVLAARLHALTATAPPGAGTSPAAWSAAWSAQRTKALDTALDLGLPADDLRVLAEASAEPPPPLPVAVCHGDFGPRNWIVRQDGGLRLQLIDFERTRVEEPVRHDLMRIVYQVTAGRPALAEAFFDGYGRGLTEAEQAACRAYAAIDCPSALKWAAMHRDREVHGYARRALDLLRAGVRARPSSSRSGGRD